MYSGDSAVMSPASCSMPGSTGHTHTHTHVRTHMRSSLCVPTVPPVVRLQLLVMWFRRSVVGNKRQEDCIRTVMSPPQNKLHNIKNHTVTKRNNVVAKLKYPTGLSAF